MSYPRRPTTTRGARRPRQAPEPVRRNQILGLVTTQPGATIQDLAVATGISHPTAAHHLSILLRDGQVTSIRIGNKTHWFNLERRSPEEKQLIAARRDPSRRRILDAITADPFIHPAKLGPALGMERTTIQWHLTHLLNAGLLEVRRSGRFAQYSIPTPKTEEPEPATTTPSLETA